MSKARPKESDARRRIVDTAQRLFYSEGIRAVGIDRIIAEAKVAKMTLYNHFPSKGDLILSVLEQRDADVGNSFTDAIDRHVKKGMSRLEAFFAALKGWFKAKEYRGCSFINASVELADAEHPASKFSATHKERFHAMLEDIVTETWGSEVAAATTPAIALLVEGAIVTAMMQRSAHPADVAKDAAFALLEQASKVRH